MLGLRTLARAAKSTYQTQTRAFSTITVTVNDKELQVPPTFTVLQACEEAGEYIPRFCYHDRLSIAGNCRMCLVEVEKVPKPVASCAYPLMPNMKIKTTTPLVKKAREGVMEFLLANHPLDCPICDQGGECDLQDQSYEFGSDRSRFREIKRAVEDKQIGPLVKTAMTRCIHCTRCVRFTREIAGITAMGTTGRGNGMEIGTYVDQKLDTELSGNVIDLCPVGALLSKPYSFAARPWELTKTESIDVMDAVGSNIRIDSRGPEVMRILPRLNEEINEEWLGDKSRFSYDGLKRQRLDAPLMKQGDKYVPVSWTTALTTIRDAVKGLKGDQVSGLIGDHADAEGIVALKDWLDTLGSKSLATTQNLGVFQGAERDAYLFNSSIAGIEDADALLLVGCNPRMEAAVLSARIRKAVRNFGQQTYSIGPEVDHKWPSTHLGNDVSLLNDLVAGKLRAAEGFTKAKKPMVIFGIGALQQQPKAFTAAVDALKSAFPALTQSGWNGINVLHTAASAVGALDVGVGRDTKLNPKAKFVYLLQADNNLDSGLIDKDAFVVYSGSHGDVGAARANIVLPSPTYTEKNATYVNMEGRVQRTKAAVGRLAEAREDWQIIRAISELTSRPLEYSTVEQLRKRLVKLAPTFAELEVLHEKTAPKAALSGAKPQAINGSSSKGFSPIFDNYFITDPISRNSSVMAKASKELPNARNSYAQQQAAQ